MKRLIIPHLEKYFGGAWFLRLPTAVNILCFLAAAGRRGWWLIPFIFLARAKSWGRCDERYLALSLLNGAAAAFFFIIEPDLWRWVFFANALFCAVLIATHSRRLNSKVSK